MFGSRKLKGKYKGNKIERKNRIKEKVKKIKIKIDLKSINYTYVLF